mmetsp:Transcript_9170/g.23438  ORF Transcript_9170/g.23438 Transcript_9170/m.23438 type:complete len:359 (-) Transcript_9170:81-1157(-)
MRALGANICLSPSLFTPAGGRTEHGDWRTKLPPTAHLYDALPEAVFSRLARSLAWQPDDPLSFWRAHNYGWPATPYHSYLYQLSDEPSNVVEAAIAALASPLAARWPTVATDAVAVEWWAHARAPAEGHQLHYDLDELAAGRGIRLQHPIVSTVLFLSALGGPTIVTSQALGHGGAEPSAAWLTAPVPNRLLAFDGRLLHGVLPGSGSDGDPDSRRVTLMMAWHRAGVSEPLDGISAGLGPMRTLPPESPWLMALRARGDFMPPPPSASPSSSRSSSSPTDSTNPTSNSMACHDWVEPLAQGPVWESLADISPSQPGADSDIEAARGPSVGSEGLRLLLASAADFDQLYLHGGAGQVI